jgi:Tfp pilus assembly protein FimV
MSIPELSKADATTVEPAVTEVQAQITEANERAASFAYGAQKLMLEEFVFLGNELLDRAQTETHLFSEFVSKMASAHSVKDVRTMYEECGKHQLDFIRRDCDRMFKHGERVIETASNLFKSHPLN